jgi:hypothetical protein
MSGFLDYDQRQIRLAKDRRLMRLWLIQGLLSAGLPSHLNLPGVGHGCEHVFRGGCPSMSGS